MEKSSKMPEIKVNPVSSRLGNQPRMEHGMNTDFKNMRWDVGEGISKATVQVDSVCDGEFEASGDVGLRWNGEQSGVKPPQSKTQAATQRRLDSHYFRKGGGAEIIEKSPESRLIQLNLGWLKAGIKLLGNLPFELWALNC